MKKISKKSANNTSKKVTEKISANKRSAPFLLNKFSKIHILYSSSSFTENYYYTN